jgi:ribosomal protein L37AE/L43A
MQDTATQPAEAARGAGDLHTLAIRPCLRRIRNVPIICRVIATRACPTCATSEGAILLFERFGMGIWWCIGCEASWDGPLPIRPPERLIPNQPPRQTIKTPPA